MVRQKKIVVNVMARRRTGDGRLMLVFPPKQGDECRVDLEILVPKLVSTDKGSYSRAIQCSEPVATTDAEVEKLIALVRDQYPPSDRERVQIKFVTRKGVKKEKVNV